MERSLIVNFLESLDIDYSIFNDCEFFADFASDSILSNINYSINGKAYSSKSQILFSDKKLNCNIFTVVCKNPKYVMYSFLFDCLAEKYFNLKAIQYKDLKGNRIFSHTQYDSSIVLGINNVLGGIPFSFYSIEGNRKRVKPFGKLVVGKNVHFSSNNIVDAGIFGDTIICDNTKIDSNTYIAHDCIIGDSTIITSGVSIGGFVKIGKNCYVGMNASIKNGVVIGNNVTIGMGTNVTKSIVDNVIVYGNPARIITYKN